MLLTIEAMEKETGWRETEAFTCTVLLVNVALHTTGVN